MMKNKIILAAVFILSFTFIIGCVSTGTGKTEEATPTPKPTPTEKTEVIETSGPTPEITAEPVATPTVKPTTVPKQKGMGWLIPEEINVSVKDKFVTELHADTDDQKLGTFGFVITYNSNVIGLDPAKPNNGIEAGPQGFVNAINVSEPGKIVLAGFDVYGKNKGTDLGVVVINWIAKTPGTTTIRLQINKITTDKGDRIGTPVGIDAVVNVK
jgi:hypothetical protein